MRQTVAIAAETAIEAIELARFYRDGLPSEALCSAMLTDASGTVIWSGPDRGEPDLNLFQKDPA